MTSLCGDDYDDDVLETWDVKEDYFTYLCVLCTLTSSSPRTEIYPDYLQAGRKSVMCRETNEDYRPLFVTGWFRPQWFN